MTASYVTGPIISTWLYATCHSSLPICLYILAIAIAGIASTALLTGYTGKESLTEYAGL
jgi:hypothetical protein